MGDRFVAPVRSDDSVTIPQSIRQVHDLKTGDQVLLELHGVKAGGEIVEPEIPEDQSDLSGFEWGAEEDDA